VRDAGRGRHGWALLLVSLLGLAATTNYTNHAPLLPLLMPELGFGPTLAGLLSSRTTCGSERRSSAASSTVMTRSAAGTNPAIAARVGA
jgi:hypothetical protein